MFEYLKTTTATGLGCMFLVSMGAFLFVSSLLIHGERDLSEPIYSALSIRDI
jgi:hypothetical protein